MASDRPAFPLKTDSYQTARNCAIILYTRGHIVENLVTHPESTSLTVEVDVDGERHVKAWAFFAEIVPKSLKVETGRVKIEIILAKVAPINWPRVEAEESATAVLYEKWQKVPVPKEEEEKNDGLDHFLQKIYKDASPEARRAMMKSIVESQGTVLSTNWEDVGARHVDPQPPKD
jgi:suppressor of G2 allele of SKP1